MPKSERWALVLRSARFINALTILFKRTISLRIACSSIVGPGTAASAITLFVPVETKSDAGKRLVDVHATELLAVGAEADSIVATEDVSDAFLQIVLLDFQIAQDAITGQQ